MTSGDYIEAYGDNIQVDGFINAASTIYMAADDSITLGDDVTEDYVTAGDDITLIAGIDDTADGKMWAKSTITTTPAGNLVVSGENIEVEGAIDIAGTIDMAADDSITLVDTVLA
ncbi:MAG: hypothetical protein ACYSTN_03920, partial [Planctomycetota bacterium]